MYRNRPIPLYLRAIYLFFRVLAWCGHMVFYRRRAVLGREHFRFDGPAIVIVNHPSTLLDVLNPGIYIRQEMYFLANYGLFRHPVSNWIFRRLFCIPVKRREDVAAGETRDNDAAFEASYRHLEQGGVLFIAPEGTSYIERVVREFRTGTARIAAGAEVRNGGQLGVKIVPIGLTYSAPARFRSDIVVQAGPAIPVGEWAAAWQADPVAAVDEFTDELRRRVRSLTIDAGDEAGDRLLHRLETMLHHSRPLPLREEFYRSQELAHRVLNDRDLQSAVADYWQQLQTAGLNDVGLADLKSGGRPVAQVLILLLGFPFFLAGAAFWFLPCALPWLLDRLLKLYVGYSSTVKILLGLITFPLALWVAYRVGAAYGGHFGWGLTAVALAIGFGLLAERYLDVWKRFAARLQAGRYARRQPQAAEELLDARRSIVERIEAAEPVGAA
jgi:glycerol-3-phosphate O-acyltransferase/dihydroxyacetone phosphate acyltransferase